MRKNTTRKHRVTFHLTDTELSHLNTLVMLDSAVESTGAYLRKLVASQKADSGGAAAVQAPAPAQHASVLDPFANVPRAARTPAPPGFRTSDGDT